ncbi:MAG: SIR2 family protein [Gammaproteobacteria bacterium]|nr:SIR2 family protein [Gammaproteobacteria bacterium]
MIPDQSHINHIREALWQSNSSSASVMIGAGFSRNARKVEPGRNEFPLWHEVAKSLCTKLYPSNDGDYFKKAIQEASGTSGFLSLAQEFEVAFGRVALHNLIQEMVPDEDYAPDDIHARLLKLPWNDVFTTNWDTLLERTQPLVLESNYEVVRTKEELLTAQKPRIIKLHGSFPAFTPFIFTEEDFRTYPIKFAPFVNTVQQAMMESIVLLIGFSGDDPNFLQWSGWVRDNLGESAPKIYLAGWLALSPHRRRMLEARNVVPIDISKHPNANEWPEQLRHQYATEWILHTLERGRPYDVTNWPSPLDWKNEEVPDLLQPVETVTINAPIDEIRVPTNIEKNKKHPELVRTIIENWEHNRKVFPGWLFIPYPKSHHINRSTSEWENIIIQTIADFPVNEKLLILRELVWRKEKILEPLNEQLVLVIKGVLDEIDCQKRTICGAEDKSVNWAYIRKIWAGLVLALLTTARQCFDKMTFNAYLETLQPFLNDHIDIAQRLHHENCLWALNNLDFAALEKLLKEWSPEKADPIWMMRKASILIETNHPNEGIRLLNQSLSIVRKIPKNNSNLAAPSRESWILWLALAFEHKFSDLITENMAVPSVWKRWEQLTALQCNAFDQKRVLRDKIHGDNKKIESPLFNLGARRGTTFQISNGIDEKLAASYQAIRMSEITGLPPSASHTVLASELLTLAAIQLASTDYKLASRLALRLASSEEDDILNNIWSRTKVASLTSVEVAALVDITSKIINYALPKVSEPGSIWVTRLRVAVEALSRLVLRSSQDHAVDVLKRGLQFYKMEVFIKEFWLHSALDHLLTRSWEALSIDYREKCITDILSAPIMGIDGFDLMVDRYPEPGNLLTNNNEENPVPSRTAETEELWAEIVKLILRGLRAGGEPRKRAATRLAQLVFWNIINDDEKKLISDALWQTQNTIKSLPGDTNLFDWVFLLCPEPEPGVADQYYRKKWLEAPIPKNGIHLNQYFWQLGNAIISLRSSKYPLLLSEEEHLYVTNVIEQWADMPIESDDQWGQRYKSSDAIEGLQTILPEINLDIAIAKKIYDKTNLMNQSDSSTSGFRLFAGLTKLLPDKINEITVSMRMGLASDKMKVSEEAILGLHSWLVIASKESPQGIMPPDDLIREIGVIIATRRKSLLNRSLQLALWIFANGTEEQCELIVQLVLQGLKFLIEELRYDREPDENIDVPLLRWGCAHLALAMSEAGYDTDPTVIQWKEITTNDPLPEVRHAKQTFLKTS